MKAPCCCFYSLRVFFQPGNETDPLTRHFPAAHHHILVFEMAKKRRRGDRPKGCGMGGGNRT